MKKVQSCGCVPFKRTREGEYVALMIQQTHGHWSFPKGHKEEGEDDQTTALREMKEETGLEGLIIDEDPVDVTYKSQEHGEDIEKHVRYFFCRVPDEAQPTLDPSEVQDSAWLSLEDLEERATYPSTKAVARRACVVLAD